MPVSLQVFHQKLGVMRKRPNLPSNFSISNLLIYLCLLEFLNNFVDMCPDSCIVSYLNKFTLNLCLAFPGLLYCGNNSSFPLHSYVHPPIITNDHLTL